MTPQDYIARLRILMETRDWNGAEALCYEVCQVFATTRNWSGIKKFFSEVLITGASGAVVSEVHSRVNNLQELVDGMQAALLQAIEKADADPLIRALYFEFDLSSGEEACGNFFLCQRYSRDPQDDWQSSFRVSGVKSEGIVDGPNVHANIDFDPDIEYGELDSSIASAYGFAVLLAILGEAVERTEYRRLPIGFALHDSGATIYIEP